MRHEHLMLAAAPTVPRNKNHREQFSREFQGIVRCGLLAGLTLPELRRMLTEAVADAREQISQEHSSEK